MAMCTQEEERIKDVNCGTLNYVRDNKKKKCQYQCQFSLKGKGQGSNATTASAKTAPSE